jgi:hypothetical protein
MSSNVRIGMRFLREDRIAIIDNGINRELICKDKIQAQIVIDENNRCIEDKNEIQITDFQHGTFCALIVEKYNSHCILNSVRILDRNGKGGIEKIEPALEWCYQHNIRVVNLSFGTTNFNECEKLKKLVNKYAYNGMIIVAATANSGFVSYPASFTNVIGVATIGSPLSYSKDYMQMGIDTVVPSEHMVKMFDEEIRTSLSNSYAAPYVCALIANRLNIDKALDIKKLKEYAREQSHTEMVGGVYEPDWVYRAYVTGRKKTSRADYYFETVSGEFNEIREEVDTVIACSVADLERLDAKNKNVIYLGKEDIYNIDVQGFFWSREIRQQQILNNHYQGNSLEVPVVVLAIEAAIDSFYILTELKRAFACDGYNAYTIEMEPECVLYGLEYMPEPVADYEAWKTFIESQVFYKQSDLVIWCVPLDDKEKFLKVYPDCDVEIILCNEGENILAKFSFENEKIEKRISRLFDREEIEEIYHIIETKLTEDEDG